MDAQSERAWISDYALLTLRVDKGLVAAGGSTLLDYRGPSELRDAVASEEPPPPGLLVDEAARLTEEMRFDGARSTYLSGQLRALRMVARRLAGENLPLAEFARRCLDVDAGWVDEDRFDAAHAELDAALPSRGRLGDRYHAWQDAHSLAPTQTHLLPGLVGRAVAETRARTSATIIALPEDEEVGCRLVDTAAFLAAGHHAGGVRSTIYINTELPFNLADLLYVVAHEGHPGHIAEQVLKEQRLVVQQGRSEQNIRFMLSPHFVISEGIGLHAQEMLFADDQAQEWLTDNVFSGLRVRPYGDFAAIHRARNVLWGVWCNAAVLASEGRARSVVADYLARWALIRHTELGAAFRSLEMSLAGAYVFCYYFGWDLLRPWLATSDRNRRVRRLLTEQTSPPSLRD